VIFSIGLSPRDNDEIWIGMDDGQVQLTRDAGKSWSNVTPADLPAWAKVSTVDASALDSGTAYIAVDNHRQDDFRPMAWRTHDFGKTWTPITTGLPANHFVGVVRADTSKQGLLYAGTDQGVWVSFDDGDHWQSLQRNLPNAIVTDLTVHGDDLVAATQGRAIWILDDLAPLREFDGSIPQQRAHLFTPATAIRVRGDQNKDTPLPREEPVGKNPPTGAIIDYWLARDSRAPIELNVLDASGKLVRHYASNDSAPKLGEDRYFEALWIKGPQTLSTQAGAHRFVWNLRTSRPTASQYAYSIAAVDGEDTPLLPEGMLVAPGKYQAVLRVDGQDYRASFTVQADPRVPVDADALKAASDLSAQVVAALDRHYLVNGEVQSVHKQVAALSKKVATDSSRTALAKTLSDFDAKLAPLTSGEGPDAPNLGAVSDALNTLQVDLEGSDRAPSQPQREVDAQYSTLLERAASIWSSIKSDDLPALNTALRAAGFAEIKVPTRAEIPVVDSGVSREMP
jgi:hypothetical protein